jgi:hypothetical protein
MNNLQRVQNLECPLCGAKFVSVKQNTSSERGDTFLSICENGHKIGHEVVCEIYEYQNESVAEVSG